MEDTTGAKPATIPTTLELLGQLGLAPKSTERAERDTASFRAAAPAHPTGVGPTIVVDASGGGAFTALSDAIRSAHSGACIKVRPGRYQEGIVLAKDVQLLATGRLEKSFSKLLTVIAW